MDSTMILIALLKCAVLAFVILNVAPVMLWLERRGSAWMQMRLGPNRIGPFGFFQPIADAIKLISKEDPIPGHVNKFFYALAPSVSVIPAFMASAIVPFAAPIVLSNGSTFHFQIADLNVGILYAFAIGSLGVYGIIMGGWASNSKYSLLGSLRSSSQMISYELTLGLSIIGIVMTFSSVELSSIVAGQGSTWFTVGALKVPKLGVLIQPLGFLLFLTAAFAETNRLPFDLPEGESEIIAGYHIEFGSLKFAAFMMAEYVNMFTASCLIASLYFGGWHMMPGMAWGLGKLSLTGDAYLWARAGFQAASLFLKIAFFMWFFVWVRWTLPRFRYDQLMDLGWKVMLPLSLANIFLTGTLIYLGVI
jgi:NADH-quinone oxidoreductase subunit H